MIYSTTISSPENLCSFPQGRGVLIRPRPGPLAARRGARRRRGLCHGGEGAPHRTGPGKIAAGRFRAGVADAEGRGARAEGPPLAIPRGRSASAGAPPRPRPLPPPADPGTHDRKRRPSAILRVGGMVSERVGRRRPRQRAHAPRPRGAPPLDGPSRDIANGHVLMAPPGPRLDGPSRATS